MNGNRGVLDSFLEELTLPEKIDLLAGKNMWETASIDRLGIPSLKTTDGPAGVRGKIWSGGSRTTFIPCGVSLAATFNLSLIEEVGEVLGKETRLKNCSILLAPTMNINRSPLGGRNFESFGEDPMLTGRMASAIISGIQSQGVGACMKHFVANDTETNRYNVDEKIDDRTLREVYLRPFKLALEAHPWTVMTSYQKILGEHVDASSRLVKDLLRSEWGFDGLVMSDWGGLNDTIKSLAATTDLEMPGPAVRRGKKLLEAVKKGDVDEATQIDQSVRRILTTIERAGVLPSSPTSSSRVEVNGPEDHDSVAGEHEDDSDASFRRIARQAAREGLVLLKNKTILPIKPKNLKRIAILGPQAKRPTAGGTGSAAVNPYYVSSPYESLSEALLSENPNIHIQYEKGIRTSDVPPLLGDRLQNAAGQGLRADFYAGHNFEGNIIETTYWKDSIVYLMSDGDVPAELADRDYCFRVSGALVPDVSGMHTFSLANIGQARLYLNDEVVIDNTSWTETSGLFMGCASREKTAQVSLENGRVYRLRVDYIATPPPVEAYDNTLFHKVSGARIGLLAPEDEDEMLSRACDAAEKADLSLVVVGLDPDEEKEGGDRSSLEMPERVNKLIKAVASRGEHVAVIVQSACSVGMPWVHEVDSIVQAWYQGQENGNALADVLLGKHNFSGKLPVTFPVRIEDHGSSPYFPGDAKNNRTEYGEGVLVGYRHFDKHQITPLWPFGFGMSYTQFRLFGARVSGFVSASQNSEAIVTVSVQNIGPCDGQEVVQVYVPPSSEISVRGLQSYNKALGGFNKVSVAAGQTRQVNIKISSEVFQWFDVGDGMEDIKEGSWRVDPGTYRCYIGNSSAADFDEVDIEVRE
ncbi:hypothetical protein D7B24_006445 [Verticillium nonalfalfae]|uniref:beta-glucosidase n=1 Tax=Verticillium nonalfalfae TaxID=1051616 RepID=A0A3M9Y965_9PEZI|nr:uncharacterized protein D7B24_006445 [Verticillium nonalfalfae]RNJ57053.1 hypothetical protein D7B24_006445 [Verticillium nonalfalfae]